jgi:hypothetical protein
MKRLSLWLPCCCSAARSSAYADGGVYNNALKQPRGM